MMENYEADMEMENEIFDDEEMENDGQLNEGDDIIQPMLLYKLDFQSNTPNDARNSVRSMIDEYNLRILNEAERYYQIESNDEAVEVYKQTKSKRRSTSLFHATINSDYVMTNYITVYYTDDGNVYAQPTGNAWHVVTKYGGELFPKIISKRLLDVHGMKSQTRLPLSGNTVFQQKRSKKPERSYASGTPNIRVRFVADLRPNASIRYPDVNCFAKSDRKIMVNVGEKFVHFDVGIKKDGMKNFINHLNKIYNGEPTYTTDGCRELDTDAFEEALRKANDYETDILNVTLKTHMDSYIRKYDEINTHLSDLDLCHRDNIPFAYGQNYEIGIGRKKIKLNETPTLAKVLDKIRENTSTTLLSCRAVSENSYLTDKIKIRYEHNGKRFNRSLFNLIEGNMMFNGQMCNRIKGTWYYMSEDHIRMIHIDFRRFLRAHLITKGPMLNRWLYKEIEGDFNNRYMKVQNFLVGDDCKYGNVELFDLLMHDPQTEQTYLYHVKKNLNGEIRTLSIQLMAACDITDQCFTFDDTNLQTYYGSIVKKYADKGFRMPQLFDKFEKFRNILSRRNNLTNICALYIYIPGVENTFRKERDAIDYFGVKTIHNAYERLSPDDKRKIEKCFHSNQASEISDLIFKLLIEKGYVKASNEKGDYGYSCSKLFLAHRDDRRNGDSDYFRLCEPPVDAIIWHLIGRFGSFFESTYAKYSLMQMASNGFNFKICEINQKNNYHRN